MCKLESIFLYNETCHFGWDWVVTCIAMSEGRSTAWKSNCIWNSIVWLLNNYCL